MKLTCLKRGILLCDYLAFRVKWLYLQRISANDSIIMQSKAEIIHILKRFKETSAHKYGIRALGIFGSFARGQQNEKSDLDIVVTLDEPDFFIVEKIKEELERRIPLNIDIVNFRNTLRDSLKENIQRDAIYI